MNTYAKRFQPTVCPLCGTKLEDRGDALFGPPKAGDLTWCPKCGAVCTLQEDMSLRTLTPEEYVDLPLVIREALSALGLGVGFMVAPVSLAQRLVDG